jgi:hypothetical protein
MMSSVLVLATMGGFISFLSTSLGVLLSLRSWKGLPFLKFKFSIDFALGLMLSAVVIYGLKHFIERGQRQSDANGA